MDDLHIIEPRRVNILEPKLSTIRRLCFKK